VRDIDMRTLAHCDQQRNQIWGLPLANVLGETWLARTNLGNPVKVWVPHHTNILRHSYFCHGWTLGTYQLHGYTVFSGPWMARVLQDEWTYVAMPAVGDICVWYANVGAQIGIPMHSARVEVVGGVGADMWVSSKNGPQPLGGLRTFSSVNTMYAAPPHNCNVRRFYRRNVALPGFLPLLPQ
jgi:hypothetical protein